MYLSDFLFELRYRRGRAAVVAVVALLVLAVGGALVFSVLSGGGDVDGDRGDDPTTASSKEPAVLEPADGALRVGEGEAAVAVEQVPGVCTTPDEDPDAAPSACRFDGSDAVTVELPASVVPLGAEESTSFNLSAVDLDDPTLEPAITAEDGELRFADADPGRYQISVFGDAGGVWQFNLEVTSP